MNRQGETILDFLKNVDTYVCGEWEEGKGHIHLSFYNKPCSVVDNCVVGMENGDSTITCR